MGIVNNIWLTKNIFMSYLAAKNPISEKVSLGNVSQIIIYILKSKFIYRQREILLMDLMNY